MDFVLNWGGSRMVFSRWCQRTLLGCSADEVGYRNSTVDDSDEEDMVVFMTISSMIILMMMIVMLIVTMS